ncbi:MAG: tRNA pseudouridine(55) synthase TruB [Lentisphaeraceae bacterium]|nr:tRNA pseudouridine(55) synthase TruB [Lentisphaeraceae bacterium]
MNLSEHKLNDPNSGLMLVDKPAGWTSHDVVNFVRRRFGFKKVGHCGTLDPSATGLLILVVGHATKVADYLAKDHKVYRTKMALGASTSSHDADGDVVEEKSADHVTKEDVETVFGEYTGDQMQIPPMVSAVKKGGKKLYELARKGIEIERDPRKITIHELVLDDISLPEISFTVDCSKGTYVRTICHDLAIKLSTLGHMTNLVRLKSGDFDLKDAYQVEEQMKVWEREEFIERMIPLAEFVRTKLSALS